MSLKNENFSLLEAFNNLINSENWKSVLSNPKMADYYASKFKKGEQIPEERVRDYLFEAGYSISQEEKWIFPTLSGDFSLLEAFNSLIKVRNWRKPLSNPKMADYYASKFKKGEEIPFDKMKQYLFEAGYSISQEEKWKK